MEGLFLPLDFCWAGVVGVLIMCLLQINRIGRKEDSGRMRKRNVHVQFWLDKRGGSLQQKVNAAAFPARRTCAIW